MHECNAPAARRSLGHGRFPRSVRSIHGLENASRTQCHHCAQRSKIQDPFNKEMLNDTDQQTVHAHLRTAPDLRRTLCNNELYLVACLRPYLHPRVCCLCSSKLTAASPNPGLPRVTRKRAHLKFFFVFKWQAQKSQRFINILPPSVSKTTLCRFSCGISTPRTNHRPSKNDGYACTTVLINATGCPAPVSDRTGMKSHATLSAF